MGTDSSDLSGGNGLHERLREAAGDRSYRHLGDLTKTHPETVRRYMQGQAPAIEFITAFVRALGLSSEWVITGRGPMKAGEVKGHHLGEANASELLRAMATTLERLISRVERLEMFVNTLETRVRASESEPGPGLNHGTTNQAQYLSAPRAIRAASIGESKPSVDAERGKFIAGGIPARPERSRSDAD